MAECGWWFRVCMLNFGKFAVCMHSVSRVLRGSSEDTSCAWDSTMCIADGDKV